MQLSSWCFTRIRWRWCVERYICSNFVHPFQQPTLGVWRSIPSFERWRIFSWDNCTFLGVPVEFLVFCLEEEASFVFLLIKDKMASSPGVWSEWPWQRMGAWKVCSTFASSLFPYLSLSLSLSLCGFVFISLQLGLYFGFLSFDIMHFFLTWHSIILSLNQAVALYMSWNYSTSYV